MHFVMWVHACVQELVLTNTLLDIEGSRGVLSEGLRFYPEPFTSKETFLKERVDQGFH